MPGQEQQALQAEEDVELKDTVSQTLESKGVLSKIRAQIRAAVFLALEDEAHQRNKLPTVNQELKALAATRDGSLMLALIYDFLKTYDLEFTLSVFTPETGDLQQHQSDHSRSSLLRQLGFPDAPSDKRQPALLEVVRRLASSGPDWTTRANSNSIRVETSLFDDTPVVASRSAKAVSEGSAPQEASPVKRNESSVSPKATAENGTPPKLSVESVTSSLATLKDAPPLFATSSNIRSSPPSGASTATPSGKKADTVPVPSPTNKKPTDSAADSFNVEISLPKAKTDSGKKPSADKKADEADADEVTPEYKDDFDESLRSESIVPNARAAQARPRGDEVDEDAEEIDDEVIEVGEDEQSHSSDNFRLRDRDDPSSLTNDPTVHSDPSLNLDYIEDVVSQH